MNSASIYPNNEFIIDESCSNIPSNPFAEIKYLQRQLCFNGYYIAYLLGQLTEKEFKKISKRFIDKNKGD